LMERKASFQADVEDLSIEEGEDSLREGPPEEESYNFMYVPVNGVDIRV